MGKINRAIALLKSGFYMIKYSANQFKPNHKVIYLAENELILKWKEPLKPFEKPKQAKQPKEQFILEKLEPKCIDLAQIRSIKDYAEGSGFTKFRKQRQGKDGLAITIIANRNLELDASSREDKTIFIECLNLSMANPKVKERKKLLRNQLSSSQQLAQQP